ncbi:MAG: HEAT repeat domain-containing protein, partial [Planctomycetes bacterium]|nr:HEAT repeat domain-containing protein [Planctomycetota bacterium]
MKNRRRLAAALVCIPLCAPLGGLQAEEPSPAEIQKVLRSSDSHVRHETWKRLNPENSRHFKILLQILGSLPWYDREGAVVALAKAATDETVSKMIEALEKDRNPFVRQGMADALAKMNDPKFYPHLYEALQDKNPFVRRVVVHSLRIHKKNEAVEALVQLFQKEEDEVVRSFIEHSLNDLTQAFLGPNPVRWLSWWEQAKLDPDYELGKTDEEALAKAEEFGQKLRKRKTVSILGGVTLSSSERGADEGVPILIIPPYGHSSQIMLPFLSELEKNHRLHYIELPLLSAFDKKKLTTVSDRNIPYYPTELLVKAFEDLRRGTGHEHFAIMACGMNSWIAMEYARLYPSSVAALIFVAPISSMKEFGDAAMRLQSAGRSRKDDEMLFFGLGRRFNSKTGESELEQYHRDKKVPEREGEGASIDRRSWSLFFKDERDSVIGMLYPVKHHPMGSVAIPDFNLLKNDPPARPIPTIVICGEASLYTSVQDCQAIGKYYRGMT